jgi:hypothetical protein
MIPRAVKARLPRLSHSIRKFNWSIVLGRRPSAPQVHIAFTDGHAIAVQYCKTFPALPVPMVMWNPDASTTLCAGVP